MTITQLHYIIALADFKHFGQAADACFVTQPTLSMQIHKLEDELGVVLFNRNTHPISPTEIGKQIIEQARVVVSEAEKVNNMAQLATGKIQGEFKLGIIPTIAPNLIPRFIDAFQKEMPEVQLVIEELQTEQIINRLRKDELDAAILATPLDERNIEEIPIYYEPFMAFVPSGHRLANDEFVLSSELDIDDLLLLNKGHCFRNSVLHICKQNKQNSRSIALESGNFETLIRLSKLGYGMTLLPYLAAIDLNTENRKFVKPLAEPTPSREVSLIFAKAQNKRVILEKLEALLRKSVPKRLLYEKNEVMSPK